MTARVPPKVSRTDGLTLVLVGPRGSGKTRLGRAVAAELGLPFHDEIGERLRRAALRDDGGANAMRSQAEFDRRVFQAELARDAAFGGRDRVVETWHVGNLAYAWQRSPTVARASAPRLRAAARGANVVVQPLRIGHAAARARLTEPGPSDGKLVDWFRSVGQRAETLAADWGLCVLPTSRTDELTVEQAIRNLARIAPVQPHLVSDVA